MYSSAINPITFSGGGSGPWKVTRMSVVAGAPLLPVSHVAVHVAHLAPAEPGLDAWRLRGTNGHTRYTERQEADQLSVRQPALNRPEASCAALIPIRKSAAWWTMAQDERRRVFETESRHIAMSMDYLPAIARRLFHGRDLGEPFDFLTWFEYAPEDERTFDELLVKLRASREWEFVDREIDIRLLRVSD